MWVEARAPPEGRRAASPGHLIRGYLQAHCLQTLQQGTQHTRPAQQGQGSAGAAPPWLVGTCPPEQGDRLGRAGFPAQRWRGLAGRGFPPHEEEPGRLPLEPGWLQLQTQVGAGSPGAEGPTGRGAGLARAWGCRLEVQH